MSADLARYSRQIVLPQIGVNGQQLLLDSCVLVIGVGGLGTVASLYLAAAGVGRPARGRRACVRGGGADAEGAPACDWGILLVGHRICRGPVGCQSAS